MTTHPLPTAPRESAQPAPARSDETSIVSALRATDLEEVVATDAALSGRRRSVYFGRRLQAALRDPRGHAQFGARIGGYLLGYLLAHRMQGEFGRTEPAFRIEVLGVHPESQGRGLGRTLMAALERYAIEHGVRELRTQSRWNDASMLAFLDQCGFRLSPALVVDARVAGPMIHAPAREEVPAAFDDAQVEVDYGNQSATDFERLARDCADFSSMTPADLPGIVRLDRRRSGRDREQYLKSALQEAMVDSAVRVSLTARIDGMIAGFLMAKVDFGDFGRTEPVAVLDTIGVDPDFAHRGIGRGLLSQLCMDLSALHVDRIESVVDYDDLDLLGFLYAAGFAPSQRLAFVKRL
jgi:ribosomal protein S18 acetylase RimI-like enzyme